MDNTQEKQVEELPKEEQQVKESSPIGYVAKDNTQPPISYADFFDLMRLSETLFKFVNAIKQEAFNSGNMRYYFEKDVEESKDKDGNTIMIKNQKGEEVPQLKLRDDFWNEKQ